AAFVRIGWPLSIGIGGRLPSESVAALPRIPHDEIGDAVKDVTPRASQGATDELADAIGGGNG
ncbi:hypothetical protein, partial [Bradyrhizobium sp. RT5a]|uniref:hypothetical protein n=1 Tax=unclassified Bradyrhizobium TaxID=2631580 RepID=UPI00339ACB15